MAKVKEIKTLEEFLEFTGNSSLLNVVKLGAPWCGPCRALESTLRGLTDDEVEGVLLAEVNVDEEWFEDEADKLKIRGIPVMIAYKNGEEVERIVGIATKDKLLEFFGRNK
jgi:thioredoxin 1